MNSGSHDMPHKSEALTDPLVIKRVFCAAPSWLKWDGQCTIFMISSPAQIKSTCCKWPTVQTHLRSDGGCLAHIWNWTCPLCPVGLPGGTSDKESACQCRRQGHGFDPWVGKCKPTPVFLPGRFHGERSPVVSSPQGHKELDVTKWLSTLTSPNAKSTANKLELGPSFGQSGSIIKTNAKIT